VQAWLGCLISAGEIGFVRHFALRRFRPCRFESTIRDQPSPIAGVSAAPIGFVWRICAGDAALATHEFHTSPQR
jgi:hypothetical protein